MTKASATGKTTKTATKKATEYATAGSGNGAADRRRKPESDLAPKAAPKSASDAAPNDNEPGVGDAVPTPLPLALSSGITTDVADHAGHWLVLYFYPKDSTPGCTTEGNEFNALIGKFGKLDATVLGVSRDSIKSHQNFCDKQGFTFDLVSDKDETLCNAFGVIKEKQLYGRKYLGIDRSTFLIGPDGRIAAAWRGVKVPGHAREVLETLSGLVRG